MSASMSELEKDIEASRARLDQTIDRIQDRLNPSSLVNEMIGSARRAPVMDSFYDSALATVRRNPIPVLLIAAGVGLLVSRIAEPRRRALRVTSPVMRTGADRTYDPDGPAGQPAREVLDETQI